MSIIQATDDAMNAILLRSDGLFSFVKRIKKGRLPNGSIMIRSGIRTVIKFFSVSISSPFLLLYLSP